MDTSIYPFSKINVIQKWFFLARNERMGGKYAVEWNKKPIWEITRDSCWNAIYLDKPIHFPSWASDMRYHLLWMASTSKK